MGFKLRNFQEHDTGELRFLFRCHRAVLYQLPTGGGKTVVAGFIAQRLRAGGLKILILVHRKELVKQFFATLKKVGLADDVGIICPGFTPTPWAPIQISMVFSYARRTVNFEPDFIFIDEAHHARANTWEIVLARYPNAKILGMTATPRRTDGKPLNSHFEVMHCGPSIPALIGIKSLAPIRVLRVGVGFGRKGIRKLAGDYNKTEMDKRANEAVVGNSVTAYLNHIPGRRTIMFGVTKRHARETASKMVNHGVRAAYVGDDTPAKVRDRTFDDFGEGRIDVVCNVGLVDEGFDVPACDAVMDVSHTASVTRYLQRIGRCLRYQDGKEAILLDLVGNTYVHGLPDIERTWSLEDEDGDGRPQSKRDTPTSLRSCKVCLTVFRPNKAFCPACGSEHDGRPVSEVDVELIEATPGLNKPPKPEPKIGKKQRGRILYDAKVLLATGDPIGAWRRISKAGAEAGYHPNWAWMLADHVKIPEHVRR